MTQSVALTELMKFDDASFNEENARALIGEMSNGLNLLDSIKQEFEFKMMNIFKQTKIIGGQLINIGKIVFLKLYQFIQENPNMFLGTIIGAVLGSFLGMVPLIGGVLSLIATFLGVAIGGYLDYVNNGGRAADNTLEKAIAGATHATKAFFKLLAEIFQALKNDF